MEFSGFDWDRGNLEKCQKQGVSAEVIESVFDRPVAVLPDETHSRTEQRLRAIGKTADDLRRFYSAAPWRPYPHTSDQRSLHA